jgi:hypothetical protein
MGIIWRGHARPAAVMARLQVHRRSCSEATKTSQLNWVYKPRLETAMLRLPKLPKISNHNLSLLLQIALVLLRIIRDHWH